MARKSSLKTKDEILRQSEIEFGKVVLARLEAASSETSDAGQSEPSRQPETQGSPSQPPESV